MTRFDREVLLQLVTRVANEQPASAKLVLVPACRGRLSKSEIMLIGRALNGWYWNWRAGSVREPNKSRRTVERALQDASTTSQCPLQWVTERRGSTQEYNTKKSAFWRLGRGLVEAQGMKQRAEQDWASRLIWSNLYKVAPAGRLNPNSTLQDVEFYLSLRLLELELQEWKPQLVIFATGWKNWAQFFIPDLAKPGRWVKGGSQYLEAHGTLRSGGRFVVVPHPARKPGTEILEAALTGLRRA